ncbi:golgi ph regulator [Chrysochromulina tobinii]|uniref:Golgi ph regulator n=1 Tax=Chrysochromulina tobinii TaxID=1460289 RepID=A0A0M0JHE5_9EUKA|nr:golgi ph regulator [Chrysochromulina tobinii]|eukprot:KOO26011.1 golgi ph regulator [Chrysochromulina sp. CCMP291]
MSTSLMDEVPAAPLYLQGVVLSETSFVAFISAPLYLVGHMLFSLVMHVPGNLLPRRLFALTFAASGALLLLVLLEINGGLPARARFMLWRLHLGVDLALIVLVLPYVLLTLVMRRVLNRYRLLARAVLPPVLLAMLAWLYLFLKVDETLPTTRGAADKGDTIFSQLLSRCLSSAGVFGVCLSALMSGVGAVAGLSISLRRLLHVDDPTELDEAQRALVHALQRLAKHGLRLRGIRRRIAASQEGRKRRIEAAASVWSEKWQNTCLAVQQCDWYGAASALGKVAIAALPILKPRLFRTASQNEALGELRAAQGESLELRAAVRREVGAFARLLDEEKRLRQASTLLGRALSVIGDVFSGYCVVKVGLAVRSILQHGARRTGVDPVTRAIGYALRLSLLDPAAAAFYSQGVSLWLTGIMVFSSVRGFLVQVMASDDL